MSSIYVKGKHPVSNAGEALQNAGLAKAAAGAVTVRRYRPSEAVRRRTEIDPNAGRPCRAVRMRKPTGGKVL